MTKDLLGSHEDAPIVLEETAAAASAPDGAGANGSAQVPAPASAPAPATVPIAAPPAATTSGRKRPVESESEKSEDSEDEDSEDDEDEDEDGEELPVQPSKAEKPADTATRSMLDFVTKHAPPAAAVASARKVTVRNVWPKAIAKKPLRAGKGRGGSKKKQGTRKNDVSAKTLLKRVAEWPGHMLKACGGQLWCGACGKNIGSAKQDVRKHCEQVESHKVALANLAKADSNMAQLQSALHDYKDMVKQEHGPTATIPGMEKVASATQEARAECVEETLKAGIPVAKIDKLRPYLERRMGISLTDSSHLTKTYIPPLKLKEEKTLKRASFRASLWAATMTAPLTTASHSASCSARASRASFSASAACASASCVAR